MQASESPGGLFADASNPGNFPSGTLADQESWEYVSPELKDAKPVDFKFEKKKDIDNLVPFKDLLEKAKIEDWKTAEADWTGTNTN